MWKTRKSENKKLSRNLRRISGRIEVDNGIVELRNATEYAERKNNFDKV